MNTPQEYINDADLELVSAYLDDEVSAQERATLEARLPREPALRATLDELRATTQALRSLPRLAPPRSLTLDPAAMRPRWSGAFTWLRLGAALAALLLALTLTIDLAGNGSGSMQTASAPASAPMNAESYTAGDAAAPTARAASETEATGGAAANADSADSAPKATAPTTAAAAVMVDDPAEQPAAALQSTTGTFSDTANLNTAALAQQLEQTAQPERSFALPTPARDAIASSGSSSPGTAALEQQRALGAAAPSGPRPLRLLEFSFAALALALGLAALWVARQRRRG